MRFYVYLTKKSLICNYSVFKKQGTRIQRRAKKLALH